MKEVYPHWENQSIKCIKYDPKDLDQILREFFAWKKLALIVEESNDKKPPLPSTFSEKFICCLFGFVRSTKTTGPDAFQLNKNNQVVSIIEIKATSTSNGRNDIKRDLKFDELYWLNLEKYRESKYEIFKITSQQFKQFVLNINESEAKRERSNIGLNKMIKAEKINPIKCGRIDTETIDGTLRIKPKRRKRYSLEELVEGITPENRHDEIDPGIAVGNEAW